eukprot:Plantae.Rhodophyta-Purpureofilum_apyrenoidigerum.ctg30280.p1 GENE.Plantae.Rhodophyta-Purpureofilum_apyrenoidigerum.ctg30280~~Plantae.Rhodophyta-Purpureofilum_apyrenoidigerum.ctg30280.p1  ORF type:complete len:214 (-),score=29.06 Plantae.Rhodophyta-Purpureofilum_apyrenoidigerum.ctg30280:64-705(-)
MAFVCGVSVAASTKSAFSGCRVSAKVVPATARWTMAKSKVAPMFDVPKNLDGSMPGDLGFDPFGFSNHMSLTWLREAELKHSRICMLACIGFLVQEFYRFPFYSSAPKLPVPAHDYFVKFGSLGQILLFTSAFETIVGFPAIVQSMQGSPRKPGDFGFDPLGLAKTDQALKRFGEIELTNGRLAMIAIGGFVHQYWLTKMGVVEQLANGKLTP